jgi:hypothetical protein
MWKPIAIATLVSGTLDILFAILLSLLRGGDPANMLRFVASGPCPQATDMGTAGAILGLVVHFSLMAIMAAVFMVTVRTKPELLRKPVIAGIGYGMVTYVVLDLIVLPLRFPAAWPPKPMSIATQLFAHIMLVGILMALIGSRYLKAKPTAAQ